MKRAGSCAALLVWLCLLPACTVRVVPPKDPLRPVQVQVYSDAWHQGLILPDRSGGHVEFSFGESDWFAFDETSSWWLPEVLLLPSAGTLAMRRLPAGAPGGLAGAYPFQQRFALWVSRDKVDLLREELSAAFAQRPRRIYFDPVLRRRHLRWQEQSYWFGNNCCDLLRNWLQRLGCEVGWAPVVLGIRP